MARCQNINVLPGMVQGRSESDRFVPGTGATLLRNAKVGIPCVLYMYLSVSIHRLDLDKRAQWNGRHVVFSVFSESRARENHLVLF